MNKTSNSINIEFVDIVFANSNQTHPPNKNQQKVFSTQQKNNKIQFLQPKNTEHERTWTKIDIQISSYTFLLLYTGSTIDFIVMILWSRGSE